LTQVDVPCTGMKPGPYSAHEAVVARRGTGFAVLDE
jgi:hypothetical protein